MLDRSGAIAYTNAKIHGMLPKSFIGSRVTKLFSVNSVTELWSVLFDEELPNVPELLLAKKIEQKALERFIAQYKKLLETYTKPYGILSVLLQYYEYENLKKIGASLSLGKKELPQIIDISPYSFLNYNAWPDIAGITEATPFSWYNSVPEIQDIQYMDNRLDLQYIKSLWSSLDELPSSEKKPIREFILESIVLKNILWVLRLKVYYDMKTEDILGRLVYENDKHLETDLFAGPAIMIVNWDVKDYSVWSEWKYSDCVNQKVDADKWCIDPCYVGQCFRKRENASALAKFHQYPLSIMALVSWFKIKQNEYKNICAAVEAVRLGVEESLAMELTGATPAKKR